MRTTLATKRKKRGESERKKEKRNNEKKVFFKKLAHVKNRNQGQQFPKYWPTYCLHHITFPVKSRIF